MQINRLFGIINLLLRKKSITAKELAEEFHVSTRTIYRDIDHLSSAGIPVFSEKGKGGGIRILEEFSMSKTLLSENEQRDILSALHDMGAPRSKNIKSTISKLGEMFNKENVSWIDIDLSSWNHRVEAKEVFHIIKKAIWECKYIEFDYYSAVGQPESRKVEPHQLKFRNQSWYLYGFSLLRNEFRYFKLTRIFRIRSLQESFIRRSFHTNTLEDALNNEKLINIELLVNKKIAHRVMDDFQIECGDIDENGDYKIVSKLPDSEFLYSYILSYGEYMQVVKPKSLKIEIVERCKKILERY